VATGARSGYTRATQTSKSEVSRCISPGENYNVRAAPRTLALAIPAVLCTSLRAAQYRVEALAVPAGQAAMEDKAPETLSGLLECVVFAGDPWHQRAFLNGDPPAPVTSKATWNESNTCPFTTASWSEWNLLEKVQPAADAVASVQGYEMWSCWDHVQNRWGDRHSNADDDASALHALKAT
jgi:hypothetical protein